LIFNRPADSSDINDFAFFPTYSGTIHCPYMEKTLAIGNFSCQPKKKKIRIRELCVNDL